MIVVELPLKTVSEPNTRSHWAARYRRTREQRNTTALALRARVRALTGPLVVALTRIGIRQGLDGDNLQGAMKAVRDGVADALGVDDGSDRVEWRYAQRRGKAWGVEIAIGTPSEMAQRKTGS